MSIITRIALALLAGVLCFGGGWFYRGEVVRTVQAPPITKIETQTVTQEKVITKVVREKVSAPDGTTKTVTTTTVEANKAKTADKQQPQSLVPVLPPVRNWSVGLNWTPRIDLDVYKPTAVEVGRRIRNDLWGTASYDWRAHTATVGVRFDF